MSELKLTKAEQAFFDSKGEKPIPEEAAKPEPVVEKVEAEKKEPEPEKTVEVEKTEPEKTEKTEPEAKVVPLAALHEERERRKESQKQVRELREREARLAGRLDILNQALQPAEKAKELDPASHPIEVLQELRDYKTKTETEQRQRTEFDNFRNAYASKAAEFAEKEPDFKPAYEFVVKSRIAELQAVGYDAQSAANLAQQDELNIAGKAFQDGVNPAERLYALAKARGYQKAEPEAVKTVEAEKTIDPMARIEGKLDTIAKGQAAGKSLSGSGGAPGENLTLEALANMSTADFAETVKRIGNRGWQKMMGG